MPSAKRHVRDDSYLLRLEPALMEEVRSSAKAKGQTIKDFMEDALRAHARADTASRNDAAVAPMIAEVLADNLHASNTSLRKLLVRVACDLLRQEYILCEFLIRANIPAKEVAEWREQGWRWAVRALKEQTSAPDEDSP